MQNQQFLPELDKSNQQLKQKHKKSQLGSNGGPYQLDLKRSKSVNKINKKKENSAFYTKPELQLFNYLQKENLLYSLQTNMQDMMLQDNSALQKSFQQRPQSEIQKRKVRQSNTYMPQKSIPTVLLGQEQSKQTIDIENWYSPQSSIQQRQFSSGRTSKNISENLSKLLKEQKSESEMNQSQKITQIDTLSKSFIQKCKNVKSKNKTNFSDIDQLQGQANFNNGNQKQDSLDLAFNSSLVNLTFSTNQDYRISQKNIKLINQDKQDQDQQNKWFNPENKNAIRFDKRLQKYSQKQKIQVSQSIQGALPKLQKIKLQKQDRDYQLNQSVDNQNGIYKKQGENQLFDNESSPIIQPKIEQPNSTSNFQNKFVQNLEEVIEKTQSKPTQNGTDQKKQQTKYLENLIKKQKNQQEQPINNTKNNIEEKEQKQETKEKDKIQQKSFQQILKMSSQKKKQQQNGESQIQIKPQEQQEQTQSKIIEKEQIYHQDKNVIIGRKNSKSSSATRKSEDQTNFENEQADFQKQQLETQQEQKEIEPNINEEFENKLNQKIMEEQNQINETQNKNKNESEELQDQVKSQHSNEDMSKNEDKKVISQNMLQNTNETNEQDPNNFNEKISETIKIEANDQLGQNQFQNNKTLQVFLDNVPNNFQEINEANSEEKLMTRESLDQIDVPLATYQENYTKEDQEERQKTKQSTQIYSEEDLNQSEMLLQNQTNTSPDQKDQLEFQDQEEKQEDILSQSLSKNQSQVFEQQIENQNYLVTFQEEDLSQLQIPTHQNLQNEPFEDSKVDKKINLEEETSNIQIEQQQSIENPKKSYFQISQKEQQSFFIKNKKSTLKIFLQSI